MPHRSPDKRLEQFQQACRQRGLPMTVQRRAVLEAILGREDHPTADHVLAAVKARLPGISRTSVYRILEMLVETGMVTKVCHPGSAVRFDPKVRQHHHLVCLRCERIIDLEEPGLNHVPLPDVVAHGFQISDYHIHFRGTCAACLQIQQSQARNPRPIGRPRAGSTIKPSRHEERKQP